MFYVKVLVTSQCLDQEWLIGQFRQWRSQT